MFIVSKNTGDSLSATEFNQIPSELENLITKAGITPSAADLFQLVKGVGNLAQTADFVVDSGAANAYVLSAINPRPGATQLQDGMRFRFLPANSSTGASTANAIGTGSKSIKRGGPTGLNTQAGDITLALMSELVYDLAHDVYYIPAAYLASSGGGGGGGTSKRVGEKFICSDTADFTGALLCDGRAVSRTTYSAYFAIDGTKFGPGNGTTTFTLPDARGQILVMGNNTGLPNGKNSTFSTRNIGDAFGEEQHQITLPESASHGHSYNNFSGSGGSGPPGGSTAHPNDQTGSAGGDQPHNNMQPSLVVGNLFVWTGV